MSPVVTRRSAGWEQIIGRPVEPVSQPIIGRGTVWLACGDDAPRWSGYWDLAPDGPHEVLEISPSWESDWAAISWGRARAQRVLVQLAHGGGHWWAGGGRPPEDLAGWISGNLDPDGLERSWTGTPVIAEPTLPLRFYELMPESDPPGGELWRGAPDEVRGGLVTVGRILGRADEAAVEFDYVRAYPTGFEFTVTLRKATVDLNDHPEWWLTAPGPRRQGNASRFCRLEVIFANGLRVSNADEFSGVSVSGTIPEAGIRSWGGIGHHRRWVKTYWVWPLPPPGPVRLVCEWRAENIPATETSIEGTSLIGAAQAAQALWEPSTARGPVGWTRPR